MKIYILDIMQKILKIIDLTTGAVLAVIPNRAWQAESFGLYASTWSIEKAIGVEIYTHIKKKKKNIFYQNWCICCTKRNQDCIFHSLFSETDKTQKPMKSKLVYINPSNDIKNKVNYGIVSWFTWFDNYVIKLFIFHFIYY